MNVNIIEKANQVIRDCDAAYLGLIDENGYPTVSTVSTLKTQNIFEVYFSTGLAGSNKVKRIKKNIKASICFHNKDNNITLVGTVEILTDQATKSHFWRDSLINHYPEGETDPNYCIIKLTTQQASLWVGYEYTAFAIEDLLKVQSRCGLLCSGCTYQESHSCTGCIEKNGTPFWGECDVAKCCMGKNLDHCGQCSDFPCDVLKGFSCGDGSECDKPKGARIEICKAWAKYNS